VKEDGLDRTCSTRVRDWKFRLESRKGRDGSQDVGVDGNKIEKWWEDVDWMHIVQDRWQWRAAVNTVMNIRVE